MLSKIPSAVDDSELNNRHNATARATAIGLLSIYLPEIIQPGRSTCYDGLVAINRDEKTISVFDSVQRVKLIIHHTGRYGVIGPVTETNTLPETKVLQRGQI